MTNQVIAEDIETIAKAISGDAKRLEGKTILITGGAGFLGNYVLLTVDYLNKHVLKKPCRIISMDNFVTGQSYRVPEGPTFRAIRHDVTKPIVLDEPIHFIIHAAGIASPPFYTKFKIETIDVGVLGTKNMLELAKEQKIESMVFFSSSEIYGDPTAGHVPTPETYFGHVSCTGPRANYDESKRLGETLCVNYFLVHNIPVKMVRPFNVYGPMMRLDDYRVIPNFVSNAYAHKPIPVYGDGRNTRTFCYVTDFMTGFFKVFLSRHEGEPFNVGNDKEEISMIDLASIFSEMFDGQIEIHNVPGPSEAYASADPKRRSPDLSKIKTKCHYFPKVDLRTGLARFVRWAVVEHHLESPLNDILKKKGILR